MNGQVVYSNALISNGTRQEKFRRDRIADKMIKHVKTMDLKEMKKHGDEVYEIHINNETALIQAYNDKKLKSKGLIKKAKKAIKRREEAAKKETVEENPTE